MGNGQYYIALVLCSLYNKAIISLLYMYLLQMTEMMHITVRNAFTQQRYFTHLQTSLVLENVESLITSGAIYA